MEQTILDKYTVVIGLEIHAQLLTRTKIYSADENAFGGDPNTHVGVITLAHPGTLPKLNKEVAEFAVKMGLACDCEISRFNIFDRKNYFYPDLPKGYQLTQDRTPICKGGTITFTLRDGREHSVRLNRIHVEEDAGKSIHTAEQPDTFLDFNRAGVPLIEIVTEPDLRSADEASAVLTEVRKLVRYLDICDGNMEEGSLRCDANVSVMLNDATTYGKKVEIKNMNSIRNVQRAIVYEAERQMQLLEDGQSVASETRLFDVNTGKTFGMRTKEELNDYRYFPDPDLSPLVLTEEWLTAIKESMPALPRELYAKFMEVYQLPAYDAQVLTDSKDVAAYFEEVCVQTKNYKAASNWVMGPLKSHLNETGSAADQCDLKPPTIAALISLIDSGKLSYSAASQKVFPALLVSPDKTPLNVAQELNLLLESDQDSIQPIIDEVVKEFPLKVEEFKRGKKGIISMFMGEVMKRSKGKADPKKASELLTKKLTEVQ